MGSLPLPLCVKLRILFKTDPSEAAPARLDSLPSCHICSPSLIRSPVLGIVAISRLQ